LLGIVLRDVKAVHRDALVADDACVPFGRHRVHPVRIHTALGSGHEESSCLVQREQPLEVQISPIHHIERAGFDGQHIQHVDLVGLAVRDMNESRNIAAQIQQSVQLDRSLGCTKRRPWKQRQTQVYGRGIQRVDRAVQSDTKALVAIQFARPFDEQRGQVFPNMPVASFVGICQRRAPDRGAKAHAVQLRLVGQQAGFDVAQTLSLSQLRKRHGAKMFGATQTPNTGIAAITSNDSSEAGPWHKFHQLCEQRLAQVHSLSPEVLISGGYSKLNMGKLISNWHQIFTLQPVRMLGCRVSICILIGHC